MNVFQLHSYISNIEFVILEIFETRKEAEQYAKNHNVKPFKIKAVKVYEKSTD